MCQKPKKTKLCESQLTPINKSPGWLQSPAAQWKTVNKLITYKNLRSFVLALQHLTKIVLNTKLSWGFADAKMQLKSVVQPTRKKIAGSLHQPVHTDLTNLQCQRKSTVLVKCCSRYSSRHKPVVSDDDEVFRTSCYDLLLSEAAADRQREKDVRQMLEETQLSLCLSALNRTHPPPLINVRSVSTSSAPSIATSSCVDVKM